MAAAGLLNVANTTGQMLAENRVAPMDSSSSGTKSPDASKTSAAGITANDFLTLLVTEMKNQDPTANTDPNEYINQLVNVNSLQQLISMNEILTGAFGSSGAGAYTEASSASGSAQSEKAQPAPTFSPHSVGNTSPTSALEATSPNDASVKALIGRFFQGNLSGPVADPAAVRLAHALDGHSGAQLSTK